MNELLGTTLTELVASLRNKQASAVELMEAVLARIDATHADLNAVVALHDRDRLIARLGEQGVASAPGAISAHREPAYAPWARGDLPATDQAARRSFLLPLYPQMTEDEIAHVTRSLAKGLEG